MIGELLTAALIGWSDNHCGVFDMKRRREGAIQNQRAGLRRRMGGASEPRHDKQDVSHAAGLTRSHARL